MQPVPASSLQQLEVLVGMQSFWHKAQATKEHSILVDATFFSSGQQRLLLEIVQGEANLRINPDNPLLHNHNSGPRGNARHVLTHELVLELTAHGDIETSNFGDL